MDSRVPFFLKDHPARSLPLNGLSAKARLLVRKTEKVRVARARCIVFIVFVSGVCRKFSMLAMGKAFRPGLTRPTTGLAILCIFSFVLVFLQRKFWHREGKIRDWACLLGCGNCRSFCGRARPRPEKFRWISWAVRQGSSECQELAERGWECPRKLRNKRG